VQPITVEVEKAAGGKIATLNSLLMVVVRDGIGSRVGATACQDGGRAVPFQSEVNAVGARQLVDFADDDGLADEDEG
jgi:hypothetical protein